MDEILGFKFVRRDLTTPRGGREMRYLPGAVIRSDHNVDEDNRDGCPTRAGDGVCVAHHFLGAQSGGLPMEVMVLVAYEPDDVLGSEDYKVRVRKLRVLDDIIDVQRWLRRHGRGSDLRGSNLWGANLSGSHLRGSDLSGADLRGSDLRGSHLRGSDLSGADLRGSNLRGSNLRGANLRGAVADQFTVLPSGYEVRDGRVVRV